MKVLSLFSGVGGFDLGLEQAGMETVFQCEWDKHCRNILDRHWPNVPKWDDITTLTGKYVLDHAPVVDVVAWGSPCQDLSVAGKRAGLQLDGGRSNLFHQGIRIIREMREASNGKYPRISIWENVYGALNSRKGADFGIILDEMVEAGAIFSEWAVLDAQYFGVPQRRRRVFVVAVFDPATAERSPNPLLPVSESMPRDTKKGKQKRQTVAPETATGFGNSGFEKWCETEHAITLSSRDHKTPNTILTEPFVKVVRSDGTLPPDVCVRRLTPLEHERLMGWPDDHTKYNADGSIQVDSHRYKQCGNGVASPVAEWIGSHIARVLRAANADRHSSAGGL